MTGKTDILSILEPLSAKERMELLKTAARFIWDDARRRAEELENDFLTAKEVVYMIESETNNLFGHPQEVEPSPFKMPQNY